jgi:hypothetical protein
MADKTILLIAHASTGEVTAWPTDFEIYEEMTVEFRLCLTEQGSDAAAPSGAFSVKATPIPDPFLVKFYPGDGFADVVLKGRNGTVQTEAVKQGVYHYEVSFTHGDIPFALLGCPSGTVKNK